MSVITLALAKAQLNVTDTADDDLIAAQIDAAQAHLEQVLGYDLATQYPDTVDLFYPDTVPADLKQAVLMLVAHWYENRESTIVGVSVALMPMAVQEIVRERRTWSFSDGS